MGCRPLSSLEGTGFQLKRHWHALGLFHIQKLEAHAMHNTIDSHAMSPQEHSEGP